MAKIQIKNSFITSSAQITISSSLVRFSDSIRAKGITGSFSGSFAGSNLFVQGGNSFGTTALLGTNDNQPLVLETNGSEKLRVTAAGNVGIGTSNPIAKLHTVGSNGSTDYVYQQWSYISSVGVYDLILKQTVTSNVVRYNFSMNNASTAYNDVLVLDRGCVGIGTSFPLSKLDVRGTMYVNYGSNGTGYIQTNGTDSDLQITTATNLTTLMNTGGSAGLAFGAGNSERMRITSGGNLGIGTTLGTFTLNVYNNADVWHARFGSAAGELRIGGETSSGAVIQSFVPGSGTVRNLYIQRDGGNVGIGTTTTSYKLTVNGDLAFNGGLSTRMLVSYTNLTNGEDWANSPISIRERDQVGNTQLADKYAPNLNFHWANRASKSVWMDANGMLNWGEYDASGIPAADGTFKTAILLATSNVGIGTTSPTQKLEVAGYAMAGESSYRTSIYGNSGGAWIGFGDTSNTVSLGRIGAYGSLFNINSLNGATSFQYDGSEKMRITTGGNVGIGTSSPNANLHVSGTFQVGNGTNFGNKFTVYDNLSSGKISFALRDTNGDDIFSLYGNSTTGEARLIADDDNGTAFMTFQMNASERMRITNGGNVGIGTTSPLSLLDVRSGYITAGTGVSTSGTTILAGYYTSGHLTVLGTEQSSGGPVLGYAVSPSTSGTGAFLSSTTITIPRSAYVQDGGTHRWYTGAAQSVAIGSAVTTSEKMRMDTNGNIGIGTSSPSDKLDINGNLYFSKASDPRIYANTGVGLNIDGQALWLNRNTNASIIMATGGGNVGIGTTSPTAKLQVGTQMYGSAPDANYFVVGNENFTGPGPVGGISGYPVTANKSQVTASLFDVIGGWERINASHALLRVSAYDVVNSTPALTVLNNGNVGMGTNSPASRLQLGNLSSTQTSVPETLSLGGTYSNSAGANVKLRVYEDGGGGAIGGMSVSSGQMEVNTWSAGKIAFYRGTTQSAIIDANGNVGIGTSSPGVKLDVIGGVRSFSSAGNYGLITNGSFQAVGDHGGTFMLDLDNTGAADLVNIKKSGTSRFYIKNDGNVGIGTSSPRVLLDLAKANNVGQVILIGETSTNVRTGFGLDASTAGMRIFCPNLNSEAIYIGGISTSDGTTFTRNHSFGVAGKNSWLNEQGGNVGIGTTSPTANLQIGTNSVSVVSDNSVIARIGGSNAGTRVFNLTLANTAAATSNNESALSFIVAGNYSATGIISAVLSNPASAGTDLVFTNYNNSLIERMRIRYDGNVGIGTTSPANKLEVVGSIAYVPSVGNPISISNDATYGTSGTGRYVAVGFGGLANGANKIFAHNTGEDGIYICSATSRNINFRAGGSATDHVTIKSDGNVGIGSTAPAYKLDVNGPIGISGFRFVDQSTNYFRIFEPAGNIAIYLGNAADPSNYFDNTNHVFRNRGGSSVYALINSSGNLGIGTSTVDAPLHIYRASNPWIRLNGGGNFAYIRFDDGTSNGYLFKNTSSDTTNGALAGAMYTYTDSGKAFQHIHSGTPLFTILSGGNVGIGATNPLTRLHVAGAIGLYQNAGSTYLYYDHSGVNTWRTGIFTDNTSTYIIGHDTGGAFATKIFAITMAGNVGIGTTTPNSKLDIRNGNLELSDSAFGNIPEIRFTGNSGGRYVFAGIKADEDGQFNGHLEFWTTPVSNNSTAANAAFAERMRITSGGNVGIGTTSAAYKLEVNGNFAAGGTSTIGTTYPQLTLNGTTNQHAYLIVNRTNYESGIQFQTSGTTKWWMYMPTGNDAALRFYTNQNSSGDILNLTNTGNVGIGTTNPLAKLSVGNGSLSDVNLPVQISSAGTNTERYFGINKNGAYGLIVGYYEGSSLSGVGAYIRQVTSDPIHFVVNNVTTAMSMISSGNVGIGTTNPTDALYVLRASGDSSATFRAASGGAEINLDASNGYAALKLYASGTEKWRVGQVNDSTGFQIFQGGTGTRVYINSSGNVGIGTTSPAQKLHIVGAVYGTTYGQFGTSVASGTNSSYAVFGSNSAVVGVKINIDSNVNRNDLVVSGSTGNVGIGTSQVLSKLNAYASGSNLSVFRVDGGNGTLFEVTDQLSGSLFSVNDVSGLPLLEVFSNNRVVAGKYGTNALVVSGSSVGIGTSRPSYRLQVSGSFAATTKSFVIKHPDPAKSDKQLVHGVTEGPEHSVFVRGKLENNNIIQLPDYWQHLVDVDTISVTLTPNKYYQQLYVKNVTDKSIEVGTETDKPINCYYYVVGERKDIPKLITEI